MNSVHLSSNIYNETLKKKKKMKSLKMNEQITRTQSMVTNFEKYQNKMIQTLQATGNDSVAEAELIIQCSGFHLTTFKLNTNAAGVDFLSSSSPLYVYFVL